MRLRLFLAIRCEILPMVRIFRWRSGGRLERKGLGPASSVWKGGKELG